MRQIGEPNFLPANTRSRRGLSSQVTLSSWPILFRPCLWEGDFEQTVEQALAALPPDLRQFMSNVAVVIEEEPLAGPPLLGLRVSPNTVRRILSAARFQAPTPRHANHALSKPLISKIY